MASFDDILQLKNFSKYLLQIDVKELWILDFSLNHNEVIGEDYLQIITCKFL